MLQFVLEALWKCFKKYFSTLYISACSLKHFYKCLCFATSTKGLCLIDPSLPHGQLVNVMMHVWVVLTCTCILSLWLLYITTYYLSSIYGISEGTKRCVIVCNYPNGVMIGTCPGSPNIVSKAIPLLESFVSTLRWNKLFQEQITHTLKIGAFWTTTSVTLE